MRFDTNINKEIDAKRRRQPIMARSKIWKYYDKIDLQTAQCLLCEKVIKTCGNTSNLMKHMKTHPQIDVNDHDSIVVRGMLKREPNPGKSRGRKKIKYASIKIKSEPKGEVDPEPGNTHMDVNIIELVDAEAQAAVESVENEETYSHWGAAVADTESATETVSAEDIIEFEPKEANDQSEQAAIHYQINNGEPPSERQIIDKNAQTLHNMLHQNHLAYFLCRDKHPLDLIEGEGFKRLVKVLCPTYSLPSVDQLAAHIGQRAHLQTAHLRQQFTRLQSLSMSCFISTTSGQQTSYLEVAAHYHEGFHRRSRTLAVQILPVQYNASSIVERLERICQRFDIDKSKIVCIVSRSNRLLETAVATLLGSQRHVPCFAYLLETLFELIVQRPEINSLCEKVRVWISQQQNGYSSNVTYQICLDDSRRALSSYEMLERYVRKAAQSQKVLTTDALTSAELDLAVELIAILAPLASAVNQLCGTNFSSYPSASNALPIAYTVLNELKQQENTEQQQHQVSYELRLFVIQLLEQRFEAMEKNIQLALSCLLDPRFRNIPFQTTQLVAKYMTYLYELYEEKGNVTDVETCDDGNTESFDIWTAYRTFSHEKHKQITMNGESDNMDEISSYFFTNISSLQTEPLLLWKDLSQFHPFLHSLAKKYLHIPASAIPPARIFKDSGDDIFSQNGKLLGEHVNNMFLLADSTPDEWQL